MSSLNSRNGHLFFDFRYRGQRCREYTKLKDTAVNRLRLAKVLSAIETELASGTFDYEKYFPGSKMAIKVGQPTSNALSRPKPKARITSTATPTFTAFSEEWFSVTKISWRESHTATVRSTLDRHLIPHFGLMPVDGISKIEILQFRATLAEIRGRNGNDQLSAKTINRIIQILSQILEEAAERFELSNPTDKIKRLRQPKGDIQPFTIEEVRTLLSSVRSDYQDYLLVRLFTGMRTGEIHGLLRKYLDFDRRQILIRETLVRGKMTYTKTDGSQRVIAMSQPVYEALQRQVARTKGISEHVFCTRSGGPLDVDDVTNRVWYPLLRHLNLAKRRPYQMRHTAATLWLASGENPEWVARQLGHANTEMLFKTYSRYVPNLTRRDGSAFDNLLTSALAGGVSTNVLKHPDVATA